MPTALEYLHENYHQNARAVGANFRPTAVSVSSGLYHAMTEELAGNQRIVGDPLVVEPQSYVFRGAAVEIGSNWNDWVIHGWILPAQRAPETPFIVSVREARENLARAAAQERLASLPEQEVFDVTFD